MTEIHDPLIRELRSSRESLDAPGRHSDARGSNPDAPGKHPDGRGGYSSWDWARQESDSGPLYRVDSAPMSRAGSISRNGSVDWSRKPVSRAASNEWTNGFSNGGLRGSPLKGNRGPRGSSDGSSDGGSHLRTSGELDDEGGSDSSDDFGPPSTSGRYHRISPRSSLNGRGEWGGSGTWHGPMTVYGAPRRLPVKIVSLLPHATEILMHLGEALSDHCRLESYRVLEYQILRSCPTSSNPLQRTQYLSQVGERLGHHL